MTFTELLNYYVSEGFLTSAQADEITLQRTEFDNIRSEIETNHEGEAAAIAQGTLFTGPTLTDVIAQVELSLPDALMYVEFPVGAFVPEAP